MKLALALGFVAFAAVPAASQSAACPPARYIIRDGALLSGYDQPATDEINIRTVNDLVVASMKSGACPLALAKLQPRRSFTKVKIKFQGCRDAPGSVVLKAKIMAPDCVTLVGKMRARKARVKADRKKKFAGTRGPNFEAPDGMRITATGGTYTNPNDGTRVTALPGAYASGAATVSVTEVSDAQTDLMDELSGLTLPSSLTFLRALQVVVGASDPNPSSSLIASIPDGGATPSGTLIHVLTEPTYVDGMSDSRTSRFVYDGEVTHSGGRFEMQVSPHNFGSPPGLSRVTELSAGTGACFIDGVVRDSNGSPVPEALVSVASLPGLVARANSTGFYRAVVTQGQNTLTATSSDGGTGSGAVTCDAGADARMSGVNLVVSVPSNSQVPVVAITDPAADESITETVRVITGTVSDATVEKLTIVTQSGDVANSFTQFAPVTDGQFSATVILTPSRDNTVVVIGENADGLVGSDSVVITVTGSAAEDLRFTMTWDTAGTDMDLHVRTPGANGVPDTVDGDTIYWTNRTAGGGELDVDDTNGFGPENTVFPLSGAPTGSYAFAAHYWSGSAVTNVTVSVFVNGFLKGSFTREMTTSDSGTPLADQSPEATFNIGTVTFPGGAFGEPADQSVFIDGPD